MKNLAGKKIAILSENGFEEAELISPKTALENAGASVFIISPREDRIRGWKNGNWSIELSVDQLVEKANPDEYDALVLPGGVINPDLLRVNDDCVQFAASFLAAGKPVAAICHGPQLLIETGMLEGRKMTSYYSVQTDLKNAGAQWMDKEVVVDNGLVTSRSPKELDAFNKKLIEEVTEGVHHAIH